MPDINKRNSVNFSRNMLGYKQEEVDAYIAQLSDEYIKIENENYEIKKKMVTLAEAIKVYRRNEEAVKNALNVARETADSIVGKAEKDALLTIDSANSYAVRIKAEAKDASDKVFMEAARQVQGIIRTFEARLMHEKEVCAALKNANRDFKSMLLSRMENCAQFISIQPAEKIDPRLLEAVDRSIEDLKDADERITREYENLKYSYEVDRARTERESDASVSSFAENSGKTSEFSIMQPDIIDDISDGLKKAEYVSRNDRTRAFEALRPREEKNDEYIPSSRPENDLEQMKNEALAARKKFSITETIKRNKEKDRRLMGGIDPEHGYADVNAGGDRGYGGAGGAEEVSLSVGEKISENEGQLSFAQEEYFAQDDDFTKEIPVDQETNAVSDAPFGAAPERETEITAETDEDRSENIASDHGSLGYAEVKNELFEALKNDIYGGEDASELLDKYSPAAPAKSASQAAPKEDERERQIKAAFAEELSKVSLEVLDETPPAENKSMAAGDDKITEAGEDPDKAVFEVFEHSRPDQVIDFSLDGNKTPDMVFTEEEVGDGETLFDIPSDIEDAPPREMSLDDINKTAMLSKVLGMYDTKAAEKSKEKSSVSAEQYAPVYSDPLKNADFSKTAIIESRDLDISFTTDSNYFSDDDFSSSASEQTLEDDRKRSGSKLLFGENFNPFLGRKKNKKKKF